MTTLKTISISALSMLAAVLLCSLPAAGQTACTGDAIFKAKTCAGDGTAGDERELIDLLNQYRASRNLSKLKLSPSLSLVANRRMLDLKQNMRVLTHSWSNCAYSMQDEKTWGCMSDSPVRLNSGYAGRGYETLYRTTKGGVKPSEALAAWKKSSLHNSILTNQDIFNALVWDEVGVAIDGEYAALWFGCSDEGAGVTAAKPGTATRTVEGK